MSKKSESKKPEAKASEPTAKKDVVITEPTNPKEGKKMLGAIVKGMKETMIKANGGVRKLSPEARKSRALKALVGAMITREWNDNLDGTFTLNSVKVDTGTDDFTVSVHDGQKNYSLQLGKGAIRELDSYMKLR